MAAEKFQFNNEQQTENFAENNNVSSTLLAVYIFIIFVCTTALSQIEWFKVDYWNGIPIKYITGSFCILQSVSFILLVLAIKNATLKIFGITFASTLIIHWLIINIQSMVKDSPAELELWKLFIFILVPILLIVAIIGILGIVKNKIQQKVIINQEEVKNCPNCSKEILAASIKCKHCGKRLKENTSETINSVVEKSVLEKNSGQRQTIIVNQVGNQSNGVGTAGFVLALIALFLSWVPGIGWFMWFLGLILSFIGMFKKPRGLAITGFLISMISLVLLIFVVGTIAAIFGLG